MADEMRVDGVDVTDAADAELVLVLASGDSTFLGQYSNGNWEGTPVTVLESEYAKSRDDLLLKHSPVIILDGDGRFAQAIVQSRGRKLGLVTVGADAADPAVLETLVRRAMALAGVPGW